MAINKRTRFEVLRRDGFRCYYCGIRGNEATGDGLTMDHVVPQSLGGSDDAQNLVTACPDCNGGKSSIQLGDDLVAEVNRAAEVRIAARELAHRALVASMDAYPEYEDAVLGLWERYSRFKPRIPADFASHIYDWHAKSVPLNVVEKGVRIALGNASIPVQARWDYAAGVIRNTMADADTRADSLVDGGDVIFDAGYDGGFHDGNIFAAAQATERDLVARHIDGRL